MAPTPKAIEAAPAPIVQTDPQPAPAPALAKTSTLTDNEEIGLIAGGGLLGLIVIGGGALALSRRKRRDEEFVYDDAPVAATAVPAAMPLRTSAPDRALIAGTVPDGFDVSRFGPHVQAAYRGPTADNPSLSLKKRLRRASFFDQRLRQSGEEMPMTVAAEAIPQRVRAQSIFGTRLGDKLGFRPSRGKVSFRPVTA